MQRFSHITLSHRGPRSILRGSVRNPTNANIGTNAINGKDAVMKFARMLLVAVLGCMSGHHALAAYPERPIRMIVPSAAGGQPDTNSRLVAAELSRQIGQQVVVDNRPGASSSIGFEAVAKAQPDGYTIGYGGFPLATNPSLLARVPYDVNKDFRMVILTNISPTSSPSRPRCP
jgi:tripartite-type tricarboxylate transporter receptor subunit TctC